MSAQLKAQRLASEREQKTAEERLFTQVSVAPGYACGTHISKTIKCWGLQSELFTTREVNACRFNFCSRNMQSKLSINTGKTAGNNINAYHIEFTEVGDNLCVKDHSQNKLPEFFSLTGSNKFRSVATGVDHSCGVDPNGRGW